MESPFGTFSTHSPEETRALGQGLGAALNPGAVVAFRGNLGSGKTCMIQGICQAFQVHDYVTSPTFILINEYGGKIKETYGVPVSEIQEGIKHGVRKVNVDTDLRLAATAAVRKYFHENPSQFDPRKYLLLSKDAMKDVVKSRLEEFGTAGNASSINSISLGEMATRYKSGEFKAVIN